jgi:hypothetical protein
MTLMEMRLPFCFLGLGMVKKTLRSRCLSLCAVFTTLILWRWVVAQQQPASEILDRFSVDKQLELFIEHAEATAEQYCSSEYIDRLVHADFYRQANRDAYNNQILARLPLLPSGEIGLYVKDCINGGFLASSWFFEWILYKWCCWYATQIVFNHISSNLADYLNLFRQHDEGLILSSQLGEKIGKLGSDTTIQRMHQLFANKNCIAFITSMVVASQFMKAGKHSLLPNREQHFLSPLDPVPSKTGLPISVFSFIERHPVISLPLTPTQDGISKLINKAFKSFGLIPEWTDHWSIAIGTELSFLFIFLARMYQKHFFDGWKSRVSRSSDVFYALLKSYQKICSGNQATAHEREEIAKLLKRYITQGHTVSFLEWMKYKIVCYGIWQTAVNCCIALPAWIKLGKGAYEVWQSAHHNSTNTDLDDIDFENMEAS